LLLLLQPASALVLAAIVLSQKPTLVQLAGVVLVCVGVLITARSGWNRATSPEPAPGAATSARRTSWTATTCNQL
jgi:hypothetical protein